MVAFLVISLICFVSYKLLTNMVGREEEARKEEI
jgi:hypothetical protein